MTRQYLVAKFGGSSLADNACITRSAKVALEHKADVIVVSATYGTTNQLVEINRLLDVDPVGSRDETRKIINEIKTRHLDLSSELSIDEESLSLVNKILDELSTLVEGSLLLKESSIKAKDRILSVGERLSSVLFSSTMRTLTGKEDYRYFDVRDVLRTNQNFGKARPIPEEIKKLCDEKLMPHLEKNQVLITQGFIGRSEDGFTTTLGRGGSDYSASLLAEGIGASCIQIWTDVAGIATTDPRICDNTKLIDEISFQEASELAVFGAKILHPTTLLPAKRQNIPVFVGSSYEPEAKGTWIRNECKNLPLVRALAKKDKQALVTITSPRMLDAHGYLSRIFEIFERFEVSVDSVTTSEISIALTINEDEFKSGKLIAELETVGEVSVEKGLSSVSLIGNGINHSAGLSKSIFESIQKDDAINVRMICLGASKHNFCLLVDSSDAIRAVRKLHHSFIEAGV